MSGLIVPGGRRIEFVGMKEASGPEVNTLMPGHSLQWSSKPMLPLELLCNIFSMFLREAREQKQTPGSPWKTGEKRDSGLWVAKTEELPNDHPMRIADNMGLFKLSHALLAVPTQPYGSSNPSCDVCLDCHYVVGRMREPMIKYLYRHPHRRGTPKRTMPCRKCNVSGQLEYRDPSGGKEESTHGHNKKGKKKAA